MIRLIADSGSTKIDWVWCEGKRILKRTTTLGINPVHQSDDEINEILSSLSDDERVGAWLRRTGGLKVCFYGAGCIAEQTERMRRLLTEVLLHSAPAESHDSLASRSRVAVYSDLLAACHALCGHQEGVACILGTGSNSCLYDGEQVVAHTPPLGYILGDEGSGAVLGKNFLNALFKGRLPESMKWEFLDAYGLTYADVIRRVYREPMANRFLASFSPFIHDHLHVETVRQLVIDNFRAFLHRNVRPYGRPDLPVHAIGSLAYHYRVELEAAAAQEGFSLGAIEKSPINGLLSYYHE